jgi:hypothetical protein
MVKKEERIDVVDGGTNIKHVCFKYHNAENIISIKQQVMINSLKELILIHKESESISDNSTNIVASSAIMAPLIGGEQEFNEYS